MSGKSLGDELSTVARTPPLERVTVERPILFSAPMVRANRREVDPKTVTRRTSGLNKINEAPDAWVTVSNEFDRPGMVHFRYMLDHRDDVWVQCPYGVEGDRLWVRECIQFKDDVAGHPVGYGWFYAADGQECLLPIPEALKHKSHPSIHMPRWASRDTLEVISARPERLHAITEAETILECVDEFIDTLESPREMEKWCNYTVRAARSQGLPRPLSANRIGAFAYLIDRLNPGAWAKNEWVWRVQYRRIK